VKPFWDDHHQQLEQRLRGWVAEHLAAFASAHSDQQARQQAPEALQVMGAAGWLELLLQPDSRSLCLFREQAAAVSPLADALFAVQGLAMVPLALQQQPELYGPWLEAGSRGQRVGAFALTEPEAGSDVAALRCRATEAAGGYELNGQKWLISNAGIADFMVVFASLNPEAGHRGIGAFLVEKEAPGFRFSGAQLLSAPHPLGILEFERCPARLISGEGFKLAMRTLDTMRISVAAAACGMARRALDEALAHVERRHQFGKPLSDFQLVQQKLAQMAIELESSRLLTYRAAWQRDQGQLRNSLEVAMAKAHATEAAQRIIDQSMQLCGGLGMLADHPVEHLYRAVRALRIYEGTTEIQHLIIARELLAARRTSS